MNNLTQIFILTKRLGQRAIAQRAHRLLGTNILICTCVAASLGFFAKSVQTALDEDIANYLGAPMVIRSNQPVLPTIPEIPGLDAAVRTTTFTTGAISEYDYQSVSLKGVSNGYPLQGELLVRRIDGEKVLNGLALLPGHAWLDERAMDELNVDLGHTVQIGKRSMLVAGELLFEPDRLTQLQHALPRIIVSQEDLASSGVGVDNDRGEHRILLTGEAESLATLEAQLPALVSQQIEVLKPSAGSHPFSRISQRAERMLNVVLVLILLMCGAAAATLANHTVQQYTVPAAILRCMGVNRRAVAWGLCVQLLVLALIMSLVGCLLGWLFQYLLVDVMQPHMTLRVASVELPDVLGPLAIGLTTVVAFVLPKLQQLGSISVTSVLQGQAGQHSKRSYSTYFCASVISAGVLWLSSDNTQLTIILVGAVLFLAMLSIGFGWALTKLSAQSHHLFQGPIKIAVRAIGRSPGRHIAPLASVSITMMAVLMTITLRGSFLEVLQIQTLNSDGNYIYSGLPAAKQDSFINSLKKPGEGTTIKGIYPVVHAKLTTINGVPIDQALKNESDTREESRSKVRLSWSPNLPDNNRLIKGDWPTLGSNDVSVEHEVMSDLGLELGDVLGFQVGETILSSTISSQREYRGGGSRIMFWFMFAPDTLADYEQTLMGGLMIASDPQATLRTLSVNFPQLRLTNLERQISGIRDIMVVLTRLMNTVLLLLLTGALMLIVASSFTSAANRQSQLTLMRALGLRRSQCYAMNVVEQLTIGLVACGVGLLGVQLIGGVMFHKLFALSYQLDWWRAGWLSLSISGAFVILGWAFAFRNLQTPVRLSA